MSIGFLCCTNQGWKRIDIIINVGVIKSGDFDKESHLK